MALLPRQIISISTGTLIRGVLVVLAFWFLFLIREVIGVLLISILLAALLDPIADALERKRIPRSLTVLGVYLIIFVLVGVLLLAIIPPMIDEMRQVIENFGALWHKLVSSFDSLRALSTRYGFEASFEQSIATLGESVSGSFANLFATISTVLGGILSFFIVLVIAFFMVVEKNGIRSALNALIPNRFHTYVVEVSTKMQHKVGQWLLGQIILMLFVGVLTYVGLLIFGVKYALLLAVIAGLTEVIPYVGPVVAAVPAVFFAATESPTKGLIVLVLYFVIQRIENMILVPKIMQKTTGLNPVMAIISLAIGYTIGGIAGLLLAIPVATALNVVVSDYIEKQNRQSA